jgi:hypothetical protein
VSTLSVGGLIKAYNKRIWLNTKSSQFTGSIVLYDGYLKTGERYSFVEISDCSGKIRIHNSIEKSGDQKFLTKIKKLQSAIDNFVRRLEEKEIK